MSFKILNISKHRFKSTISSYNGQIRVVSGSFSVFRDPADLLRLGKLRWQTFFCTVVREVSEASTIRDEAGLSTIFECKLLQFVSLTLSCMVGGWVKMSVVAFLLLPVQQFSRPDCRLLSFPSFLGNLSVYWSRKISCFSF